MSEKLTVLEWHKQQAVTNFNAVWDLIEKADRSWEDDLQMIHMAHAPAFTGARSAPPFISQGANGKSPGYMPCSACSRALYSTGKTRLNCAWRIISVISIWRLLMKPLRGLT